MISMSEAYRISESEYKRACKTGAESIIGSEIKRKYKVSHAEVAQIEDTYWLSFCKERKNG